MGHGSAPRSHAELKERLLLRQNSNVPGLGANESSGTQIVFSKRALIRHAQHAKVIATAARIIAPFQRRINHHLTALE